MSIISLQFFIALIGICIVYFALPAKVQWVWLLVVSAGFYYSQMRYSLAGCVFFLVIIFANWAGTLLFEKKGSGGKNFYKLLLAFDIATLALFKYSGFLYEIILAAGRLFGADLTNDICGQIVYYTTENCPERISYFMLILIAYITDVFWGKSRALKNPAQTLLYASYFPLMTSGPIVNFEQMEHQLFGDKHRFSYDRCVRGTERVLWGLFKKLVISERLAVVVSRIYDNYEVYNGLYIFVAAAMFAIQLYCDFSGLMDIVLGVSEVLGIILPENFETPFYSVNLSEFWRRWHITLGGFLRDYVLYPIQMSRGFKNMRKWCKEHLGKGYEKKFNIPLYLSLLVSWFLIGLWHGGGWNYIFGVGLYMWAVIVIGDILNPVFARIVRVFHINTECASYSFFLRLRTFILFMVGLSFFRAKSLRDGFLMWKFAFFRFNPWIFFDESFFNLGLDRREWGILCFGLMLLVIVSHISQKRDVRDYIRQQNFVARLAIFGFLFVMTIVYGYFGVDFNSADFIYGRF